jgi:molybdopterin-containing oxidoreductase family iron-sulfur binding subunit
MVFDIRRCIGCNACVVGCKQENSLPDGVFFTRTLSEDYGVFPNAGRVYIPTLCNQCEDAPCEKVCPSGATYTREDGIVMVDDHKCIGCNTCAVACPYDQRSVMSKDAMKDGLFGEGELTPFEDQGYSRFTPGTVTKCDFCRSGRSEQQAQQADQGKRRPAADAGEKHQTQGLLRHLTGAPLISSGPCREERQENGKQRISYRR